MRISKGEIEAFPKLYRNNLINSVSGFKSANLIGSVDQNGNPNLAIFSSVLHLGSDPAILGFITRPHTVPRHTYENIKSSGYYTINHVHHGIAQKAHQTSARYDQDIDEFEVVGLTKESSGFPVPYVRESFVKVGLSFEEDLPIHLNGTIMIIGKIQEVILKEDLLKSDGFINLSEADTVTVNGLDGYVKPILMERFSYARPFENIEKIH